MRRLAAALAPAYLRVSGSWANATYFADSDSAPSAPPPGFNSVLSRRQWRGVVDFSQAVGAQIVTSFAASPGTRDAAGVWLPDQARRFLSYTYAVGGRIAAAEFINEPNVSLTGAAPAGDDAAAYARDFRAFRSLVKQNYPEILILGPGTVGEAASGFEPARCIRPRQPGWDLVSSLWNAVGAMQRYERTRGRSVRRMALADGSDLRLLPVAPGQIRARQADLADRNRGGRMRRKPVGRDLPGYVQISRSTRPPRESRRSGGDA